VELRGRPSSINRQTAIVMRKEYSGGFSIRELANRYKLSYGTISNVIHGTHPVCRDLPNIAKKPGG
jgi:Mor family transcriptional regulator